MRQYQKEERSLIANRARASQYALRHLLKGMKQDNLAPEANVHLLREELSEFYKTKSFLRCENMGDILETSLRRLF